MGMFDHLFDADGNAWQTKAFDCALDVYQIGDPIDADGSASFQVEILGGNLLGEIDDHFSLATIISGVLVSIDDARDRALPCLNYSGHLIEPAAALIPTEGDPS